MLTIRLQPSCNSRAAQISVPMEFLVGTGITRIAVTPPSTICRRSTTKGATTQRSQPQALRRPLNRGNSTVLFQSSALATLSRHGSNMEIIFLKPVPLALCSIREKV
jgi:hypothetical protein